MAREVINRIQRARKSTSETLATRFEPGEAKGGAIEETEIEGTPLRLGITTVPG